MKLSASVVVTLLFIFTSRLGVAAGVDCSSVKIKQLVTASNYTLVVFDSANCGAAVHACLDTHAVHMSQTQSNRFYTLALARMISGQESVRLTYENSTIVAGCGFPLVVELR